MALLRWPRAKDWDANTAKRRSPRIVPYLLKFLQKAAMTINDEIRLGIDLGGTKVEGIALRRQGEAFQTLARVRRPTERDRGYEHILEVTAQVLAETEREAGLRDVARVGVGMPGSLTLQGLVKNANTTALNGRPFRTDLIHKVGRPMIFANDANCFALAERVLGAAQGARIAFGV